MLVHRINVLQKASMIICPPVRNCWNCGPLQRQIEDVKGKGCLTKGISEKQQWGRLAAYLNSVTTVQSASGTLQAVTMPQIGPPLTRISLLTETETASGADTSVINMESFEAQGMNQSHLESGEFVLHNPDGTRTSCIPIDPITIVKPFARCHDDERELQKREGVMWNAQTEDVCTLGRTTAIHNIYSTCHSPGRKIQRRKRRQWSRNS